MGSRGSASGIKRLTKNEQNAIEEYVSGDGMWINQFLRGRGDFGELTSGEEQFLKDLDKATNKTIEPTTLYRSVDAEAVFGAISDGTYEDLSTLINYGPNAFGKGNYADTLRSRLNGLVNSVKGKTVTEKGFMSTTKDYNVASEWGDFTGSSKPVVLEIKTSRGVKGVDASYTDSKANGEAQKEVLLKRNQRITYNNVRSKNGQIYIECTLNS